jgi:hypothetical protein
MGLEDTINLLTKLTNISFPTRLEAGEALYKMLSHEELDKNMEKFLLSNLHLYCGGGIRKGGVYLFKAISQGGIGGIGGIYEIKFNGEKFTIYKCKIANWCDRLPIGVFQESFICGKTFVRGIPQ